MSTKPKIAMFAAKEFLEKGISAAFKTLDNKYKKLESTTPKRREEDQTSPEKVKENGVAESPERQTSSLMSRL